jgi:hypothetical protein
VGVLNGNESSRAGTFSIYHFPFLICHLEEFGNANLKVEQALVREFMRPV